MSKKILVLMIVFASSLLPALSLANDRATAAAGDPLRGRRLYMQCQACHSVEQGGQHKVGPALYGIVGERAATRQGFRYSDRLTNSGVVWTPAQLDAFLRRPSALVPGNRMAYSGMASETDRRDVISYLQSQGRTRRR